MLIPGEHSLEMVFAVGGTILTQYIKYSIFNRITIGLMLEKEASQSANLFAIYAFKVPINFKAGEVIFSADFLAGWMLKLT